MTFVRMCNEKGRSEKEEKKNDHKMGKEREGPTEKSQEDDEGGNEMERRGMSDPTCDMRMKRVKKVLESELKYSGT